MRMLSGAVLVVVMALGAGGIGCSDGDAGVSSQLAAFEASIHAAQAAADNAQAAADSASTSAANAQGTADSASAAASNAQNAANNAQGTATSAQNAANTAQDSATVNAEAIRAGTAKPRRFLACVDGLTVEDPETGLLWERKTTRVGVHDVSNLYNWSSTGAAADGTAYTVFLADLNTSPGFAGHMDWRLPFISELQSILVGSGVLTSSTNVDPADPAMGTNPTGQATACAVSPCIDYQFAALGGPTASLFYWSASSFATTPNNAWVAFFNNGIVGNGFKSNDNFVRAVRAGSCSS